MSVTGRKIAAEVFEIMQLARGDLLNLGSLQPNTTLGQEDILLGQLLEQAKEHIKDRFCEITTAAAVIPPSARTRSALARPHGKDLPDPQRKSRRSDGRIFGRLDQPAARKVGN